MIKIFAIASLCILANGAVLHLRADSAALQTEEQLRTSMENASRPNITTSPQGKFISGGAKKNASLGKNPDADQKPIYNQPTRKPSSNVRYSNASIPQRVISLLAMFAVVIYFMLLAMLGT